MRFYSDPLPLPAPLLFRLHPTRSTGKVKSEKEGRRRCKRLLDLLFTNVLEVQLKAQELLLTGNSKTDEVQWDVEQKTKGPKDENLKHDAKSQCHVVGALDLASTCSVLSSK
jgi:DNA-directed RNA polymerase alpha subunit